MGKTWKRHFDQLKPRLEDAQCEESETLSNRFDSYLPSVTILEGVQDGDGPSGGLLTSGSPGDRPGGGGGNLQVPQIASPIVSGCQPAQPLRQSSCMRHPPKRLIEEI